MKKIFNRQWEVAQCDAILPLARYDILSDMKTILVAFLATIFALQSDGASTAWDFLSVVTYMPTCHHLHSDSPNIEICLDIYASSFRFGDHGGDYISKIESAIEGSTVDASKFKSTYLLEIPSIYDTPFYIVFQETKYGDPSATPMYGWAELLVGSDNSLTILHSALNLDGASIVVGDTGAIPEPSGGTLLLLGSAALFLRRRRT